MDGTCTWHKYCWNKNCSHSCSHKQIADLTLAGKNFRSPYVFLDSWLVSIIICHMIYTLFHASWQNHHVFVFWCTGVLSPNGECLKIVYCLLNKNTFFPTFNKKKYFISLQNLRYINHVWYLNISNMSLPSANRRNCIIKRKILFGKTNQH